MIFQGVRESVPPFFGRTGLLCIYCSDMEKYKTAFVADMDRTGNAAPPDSERGRKTNKKNMYGKIQIHAVHVVIFMKQILNLTPHTLVVGGNEIKSAGVARVSETSELVRTEITSYGEIPIFRTTFGHVIDLPEEKEDTILVVSAITARAAMQENPARRDIFVPGKQIRDIEGRIVGCEGIAIY